MTLRDEIIQLQREIYTKQQRVMQASFKEGELSRYEEEYDALVSDYYEASTEEDLNKAIQDSDIVYVADYHAVRQSQKTVVRALDEARKSGKDVVLGLEMVLSRQQDVLDRYMTGRMSDKTFLKRINYEEQWGYNWEDHKMILDYCKEKEVKVVAINSRLRGKNPDEICRKRDRHAAKKIEKIVEENPNAKIVVTMGDLHMAKTHLPLDVKRKVKGKKDIIIHQNVPELYWKLAEQGLEHKVDTVRIDHNTYCVMKVNPIVAQQHYLNWQFEEDITEEDNAVEMIKQISEMLELGEIDTSALAIYTHDDMGVLFRKLRKAYGKENMPSLKKQIREGSRYFPRLNGIYLSDISINHIAEEAAHFINHMCSDDTNAWEEPRGNADDFYTRCMREALGWLGSKIINPKRECNYLEHCKKILETGEGGKIDQNIAMNVFTHLALENGNHVNLGDMYSSHAEVHDEVTHTLGYILGEKMFNVLMDGELEKKEVAKLFFRKFTHEKASMKTYFEWSTKLNKLFSD